MGFGSIDHDTVNVNIGGRSLKEVEIVDETHPLYGRKFEVSPEQPTKKSIRVKYNKNIQLLIPIASTNLHQSPKLNTTKLTYRSIEDIILLFKEINLCQLKSKRSGKKSRSKNKTTF